MIINLTLVLAEQFQIPVLRQALSVGCNLTKNTMNEYSQKVIDQFFQTFYHGRIEIAKEVGKHYHKQLDTSLLTFWFSVIDFYGGLYYLGTNTKKTYDKRPPNGSNLKFAHKDSFINFIKEFFPTPENELGEFLYTIFRSGLVHQLSPKKGEILWDATNQKLLWVKIDLNNQDNKANKVATINIYRLQDLAFDAYKELKRRIENDELEAECENIFNQLLTTSDILEDGTTINTQYNKLPEQVKSYITT